MEIDAVRSLTALQAAVYQRGDLINIVYVNGFNSVKARNALMKYANDEVLAGKADYVLWLDSDHVYDARALYALIQRIKDNGLEMLAAKYYIRSAGKLTAHGNFVPDGFKKFEEPIPDDLVDCDVLGFGFLVMTPDFVRKMWNAFPDDLFKFDCSENSTEDVYFCRQAQKLGTRICFDNRVVVGHLTTVVNT